MGETWRGEGKTAKKEAITNAPVMIMMTSNISTVRIMLASHLVSLQAPQCKFCLIRNVVDDYLANICGDPFSSCRAVAENYRERHGTNAPWHEYDAAFDSTLSVGDY
jgi:hypothetical protein